VGVGVALVHAWPTRTLRRPVPTNQSGQLVLYSESGQSLSLTQSLSVSQSVSQRTVSQFGRV